MIRASRTAFVENPDGSIQCVVTIPSADRAKVLAGDLMRFPTMPGEGAEPFACDFGRRELGSETLERWRAKAKREAQCGVEAQAQYALRTLDERLAEGPDLRPIAPETSADYTVDLEAQSAADRPPAQTVGVGGFDAASVVEAVAAGSYTWDHPAAAHMATIFRHEPFQRFAMMRLHADAFAAPMECATRFITKAVKDKPIDAAMAALTARMNEYMAWAASNRVQMWPNGSKS